MQKLGLNQSLTQKLSPQQIQFIKLLQIPTAELDARIEEEMEINPALEEGKEESSNEDGDTDTDNDYDDDDTDDSFDDGMADDLNVDDYLRDDDISGYKMQGDGGGDEEDREMPIAMTSTLTDSLLSQLGFLKLDERQSIIGKQLVGSIDNDGYIRRELEAIVNDLAFSQNIETTVEEVEDILHKIQSFDPAGIAARNLQECLLLQLDRKDHHNPAVTNAIKIIDDFFEEFTKKHYDKIQKRLNINDEEMKDAGFYHYQVEP
jgi:RNA polymerase sigma-54 factor